MLLEVIQKFKDNLHSQSNKDGLLRHNIENYLGCFHVYRSELDAIFDKDKAQWLKELEKVKNEAEDHQN